MPLYTISYHTRNTYVPFVREAVLEFLVLPETSDQQEIIEKNIRIEPVASPGFGKNIFGFEQIRFSFRKPVSELRFSLQVTVRKEEVNPYNFVPLSLPEERFLMESDEFIIDNYLFLNTGTQPGLPSSYSCPLIRTDEAVFDFIKRVNSAVHQFLVYDATITDPARTLLQTVTERKGVCQDYAHLMLAVLRKNHIPARYVSGYLNQGEQILGAGAVHAWVQALIPGIGWLGFDPTNNLLEDHHYIKIAHGVDIGDCATLKGFIKGAVMNQTDYHVLVTEQNKEINQ